MGFPYLAKLERTFALLLRQVRRLATPLAGIAAKRFFSGPEKPKEIYFSVCTSLLNT